MDFYQIKEKVQSKSDDNDYETKKCKILTVYPDFCPIRSKDLMVRGRSFYAIWDNAKQMWSTDEADVQRLVDQELDEYAQKRKESWHGAIEVKRMISYSSNVWHNYKTFLKDMFDSSHQIDENITFSNTPTKKSDYVSQRLPYPLEEGSFEAYDELMSTLYDEEERQKLEWAIGAIISGDAKHIQKFIVLYGEAGSGKSTFLNIVQKLFAGYYTTFEAKALTSQSNSFSTEVFKANPLVAIQHDGDLSKIEDNTKLNSIISHEEMTMNEKFKPSYTARSNAFLFMGTNKPVKITDAKSGIIRRLIDVRPSGNKVSAQRYHVLMSKIDFELGAIAYHCLEVYHSLGKNYYSNYRPLDMMYQTDVFFNFVEDSYHVFKEQDGIGLNQAYEMYKQYCEEALVEYKLAKYKFREELKSYFEEFSDRARVDGKQFRSYYSGFLSNKFNQGEAPKNENPYSLVLDYETSKLDDLMADYPAQYATTNDIPGKPWKEVTTKLSDLDTHKVHYVRPPENRIVIDFDLKDKDGKKSMALNLEAASKWPSTYAEFSKSGAGIHLHYIYDGDVSRLSRIYDKDIEIKVFSGQASLRRKLSKCNNLPIATLSSGLPLKGEKMVDFGAVKSEKGLRTQITRNLNKEIHASTKPSVDFIHKILEDAYASGMKYDVTDMRPQILAFANNSSNQSEYCVKLVQTMHFASEEASTPLQAKNPDDLIFYDVEVFPNLFVVVWKRKGYPCVKMINPTPAQIEELLHFSLVGFNCRRYDNHILYARYIGYDNYQLYELSKKIIDGSRNCFFGEAYNISYTDVYDFASAGNKQSLKKFEIQLGIHHQELGLPWDKPVPEELWELVADYCCNDVIATEATFYHISADWLARQILADLAGKCVNDTTNMLTTEIIFGNCRKPQDQFNWRNLAEPVHDLDKETLKFLKRSCPEMMAQPHGKAKSLLPYFEGYTFDGGKSLYMGEEVGEGGYVHAEPGMYFNVAVLDVASMHPHSAIAEALFGVEFTTRFQEIVEGRVSIKHKAWDEVNQMLDGKLTKYIQKVIDGELTAKDLSNALKTAINSVYGLTSAKFENKFRDPRNKDNIVAKRGALFMIALKHAVQEEGFSAIHIKTDSIKIPNATPEVIKFVMDFGKRYGYTFEHEATYDRICLVNDAVYIARYSTKEKCQELYGYIPDDVAKHPGEWTATGAQFAQPYVFKTLFSHEPIVFEDLFETKTVTSALYLDMNETLPAGEHDYHFIGKAGAFCPMIEGCGGGILCREKDGKYGSATGAKGYKWLEAEMVKELGLEHNVDRDYYNRLVDDAVDKISKYGDFERFVSDFIEVSPEEDPIGFNDIPPWCSGCGKKDCTGCSNWDYKDNGDGKFVCKAGFDCLPF